MPWTTRTEQLAQPGVDVRARDEGVRRHLTQAHPEAHLVLGQAPVRREPGHVGGHDEEAVRRAGDGQLVLAQRRTRHVPDGRAQLHGGEHRAHRGHPPGQELLGGVRRGGAAQVDEPEARRRVGAGGVPRVRQGLGGAGRRHRVQEEPPVLQGVPGPRARPDGQHLGPAAGPGHREPGELGHVQFGEPGELLECDAVDGFDVGLRHPAGGHALRQRAGQVDAPAAGGGASHQLQEVTEDPLEEVVAPSGAGEVHFRHRMRRSSVTGPHPWPVCARRWRLSAPR